jgi:hypothetical protein
MLLVAHLSPTSFYSNPNEVRTIYNLPYCVINTCFFSCINASNPWMNHLTTVWEHLRLFWRLGNGTKISDAKFVRCYLKLFRKSPRKSSRWDLFPEPDCVTSTRSEQLRITFNMRKKSGPRKPWMFYKRLIAVIWTRPEPGPDPNIICATRPGPRARSGRDPGPCRPMVTFRLGVRSVLSRLAWCNLASRTLPWMSWYSC